MGVKTNTDLAVESFVGNIANESIRTVGPELIFGTLFDHLGFNVVPDELFRHLTIARLVYPTSKLKTADYLWRYRGEKISVDRIYRFLDTLNKKYKEQVEDVAFQNTKKLLGQITVVFYGVIRNSGIHQEYYQKFLQEKHTRNVCELSMFSP